jgi:hypothetical protein
MRVVHNGEIYKLGFQHFHLNASGCGKLRDVSLPNGRRARKARAVTFAVLHREAPDGTVDLVAEEAAICSRSDNFDKETGRQLALGRLQKKLLERADAHPLVNKLAARYFTREGAKGPRVMGGFTSDVRVLTPEEQAQADYLWEQALQAA